ncbi:MAG: hypothetical protein ABI045_07140 [Flavobacteriales bacterium]
MDRFNISVASQVFIKTHIGFYPIRNGKPNDATLELIQIILKYTGPLPIKATGNIPVPKPFAKQLITLGVKCIGTSSVKILIS